MRVLVTWGSKLGGTAGIAQIIASTLAERGIEVVAVPAAEAPSPTVFDAVIIGGALYANRWPRPVRRYLERHARELARIPTWLFSSGPLDDSADTATLPVPHWMRGLIARIGAIEHHTFGGRLEADVKSFPAAAMAKEHAGDWRNPDRIRAWAIQIAGLLPTARPRPATTPAGASPLRLVEYGVVAWALAASVLAVATPLAPRWLALALHLVAMPAAFAALAVRYHSADGARAPGLVALVWSALAMLLDLGLLGPLMNVRLALASSLAGMWIPLALAFLAAWAAGTLAAMLPFPAPRRTSAPGVQR
jgi:menaquinone-dependent protoporphyrinogen oxidase